MVVSHSVATNEAERFELSAAFSQLDQAPTAHYLILYYMLLTSEYTYEIARCSMLGQC